jgi:hypothetical protein
MIADMETPQKDSPNPDIKPIEPPLEPDYETLEPEKLCIRRHDNGRLRATVENEQSFLDVQMVRCFPQSLPEGYWALTDRKGRVIGVVYEPTKLDEESFLAAEDALKQQYFLPVITAVHTLKEEFGAVYFDVDTDRGHRVFVAKGVRESVEEREGGEIFLVDVDENRYVIPDWTTLDPHSQKLIDRIV